MRRRFRVGALQHRFDVVLSVVSGRMPAIRIEQPDDRGDVGPSVERPPSVLLPFAGEHLGGVQPVVQQVDAAMGDVHRRWADACCFPIDETRGQAVDDLGAMASARLVGR